MLDQPAANAASDVREALARVLQEPVRVMLPEFGVIAVSGADAVSFLQTQLTNDVTIASTSGMQLNGYCTAKGRLLATFHQWRDGETVFLRLPRELLPGVIKRLSMFVLRAKAKLADVSDAWTTLALVGPGSLDALRSRGFEAPTVAWNAIERDGVLVARMPPGHGIAERFLVSLPAGAAPAARVEGLPDAPPAVWWWSEIAAAVPTVFAATQEKFVPQMINFEVLGGVSFRKGCYPGQEIVARSQYLGKLKRRMNPAHADADPPAAGTDVFHSDAGQAIGTVVMAARAPRGGTDLLFEAPIDRLTTGTLTVGMPGGAPLALRPLPYPLFDPTE